MADWSDGDWVFAYYDEDEYWYPAEIVRIEGNDVKVRYDYDDSKEVVTIDYLDEYSTFVGEKGAESYSDEDEAYYPVVIKEVNEENILVEYEDGSAEWTDLSYLRFAKQ